MNMLLPLAMRLIRAGLMDEASSALPDAPVVPEVPEPVHRPHAVRSRIVLAHSLERAAAAVAPKPV
jgi:hypothetical protein